MCHRRAAIKTAIQTRADAAFKVRFLFWPTTRLSSLRRRVVSLQPGQRIIDEPDVYDAAIDEATPEDKYI